MFDLGTALRLIPLKTSGRFCRRAPTSCEQQLVQLEQLTRQLQKAWAQISPDVLYTGVRHAGRHSLCITNNGGIHKQLKASRYRCIFFPNRRENDVRVIFFHPVDV